ncbi:MAG TPA: hypothetical protein VHG90_14425 [Acidimicrobiales bacterium]|nr:hypothetical protein [Acidimicrobiales bacterium]
MAAEHGLGWRTVWRAVQAAIEAALARSTPPTRRRLGMDETSSSLNGVGSSATGPVLRHSHGGGT